MTTTKQKPPRKPAATPLGTLVELRNRVIEGQAPRSGCKPKFLGEMTARERAEADRISRDFHDADQAIVEELKRIGQPVTLGGIVLHLTADCLNFVELDAQTGMPLYGDKHSLGLLYRYPAGGGGRP